MFDVSSLASTENCLFSPIIKLEKIIGDKKEVVSYSDRLNAIEQQKMAQLQSQIRASQAQNIPQQIQQQQIEPEPPKQEEVIQPKQEEPKSPIQPEVKPIREPEKKVEEPVPIPEPKIIQKKYKLSSGPIVKVSENYSTDDKLEKDVVELLNNNSIKWEVGKKGKEKPICISIRDVEGPGGLQCKNECTFPYDMMFVVNSITDLEMEKKWHKGAEKSVIISKKKEDDYEVEIKYALTKFPWPMSDRDWLTERKIFFNYCGDPTQCLIICQSTTHPKYPVKDNPVRAEIAIQGHHFKKLDNNSTKLTMVTQGDVKISGMKGMARKKMPEGQYKFFEEWLKGLKSLSGKK